MKFYTARFYAMASVCDVTLMTDNEDHARTVTEQVRLEVARIEIKYSRYQPDSVISHINAMAGLNQPITLDDETKELLNFSTYVYELSDGLFDITSGALSRAWDIEKQQILSQTQLDGLLGLVGWDKVGYQGGESISLPIKGMSIDFGGFGKEYAVDCAKDIFLQNGLNIGFINFGGDIYVLGAQPDGQAWKIGIKDPFKADGIMSTIPMRSGGLATSGDYERCFMMNGKRYSHIIHPKTGYPVDFWRSVSVVAQTTLEAGYFSTIAMLMPDAEAFLSRFPIKFLLIAPEGKIIVR
jgi:thiamine biosynthesis lipoprotein